MQPFYTLSKAAALLADSKGVDAYDFYLQILISAAENRELEMRTTRHVASLPGGFAEVAFTDLKGWLAKHFPNERPAFLYGVDTNTIYKTEAPAQPHEDLTRWSKMGVKKGVAEAAKHYLIKHNPGARFNKTEMYKAIRDHYGFIGKTDDVTNIRKNAASVLGEYLKDIPAFIEKYSKP